MFVTVILTSFIVTCAFADNPAVLRQFNHVVNSDACLKQCMAHLERTNLELSMIRRSNLSDHLLNIELVCETIRGSRACLEGCEIESNPFALRSVNALCEELPRKVIEELRPCLESNGRAINLECTKECGDYEAFHEQINKITEELAQQPAAEPAAEQALNKMSNNACRMFKCTERCTVLKVSARCGRVQDGNDAGGAVRFLIEHVFGAHRADLDQMQLTRTLALQSQPECNYLYTPEIMFDVQKDRLMVLALTNQRSTVPPQQVVPEMVPERAQLVKEQLNVLAKQERNLDLEAIKLEKEVADIFRQQGEAPKAFF